MHLPSLLLCPLISAITVFSVPPQLLLSGCLLELFIWIGGTLTGLTARPHRAFCHVIPDYPPLFLKHPHYLSIQTKPQASFYLLMLFFVGFFSPPLVVFFFLLQSACHIIDKDVLPICFSLSSLSRMESLNRVWRLTPVALNFRGFNMFVDSCCWEFLFCSIINQLRVVRSISPMLWQGFRNNGSAAISSVCVCMGGSVYMCVVFKLGGPHAYTITWLSFFYCLSVIRNTLA